MILEKMPFVGGASAICGGQYSAANTPYQIERGIKDDDEHFLKNMLDIGGHVNDPELVKAYIKEALSHFIWLSDHGVHPSMVYAPSGISRQMHAEVRHGQRRRDHDLDKRRKADL